jgi:hypothetical protein
MGPILEQSITESVLCRIRPSGKQNYNNTKTVKLQRQAQINLLATANDK